MNARAARHPDPHGLWLGKPAPRYTSYPPAPFFKPDIGAEAYAHSLAALPPEEAVSLYIHIPFCRALCFYCGCNMAVTQRTGRVSAYLDSVKREADLVTQQSGRRRVSHLHFGGGTPNIMTEQDIHDLFGHLLTVFDFSAAAEIAMELDPRTVTREQVAALAANGVTRVSLGVQDINPEVQVIINRIQPHETVAQVCDWLREAGITRINFDLIYGLPKQTPQSVADTARQVSTLQPDRIALFSYAHVPQMKRHQKALEDAGLPDLLDKLAMEDAARAVFADLGYLPIGIDHFVRATDSMAEAWRTHTLHRNFQGYTNDKAETLIGLGCSSICQTPGGYFQNAHDERPYRAAVDGGSLATGRGYLVTPEDRLRRAIIEQLMCYFACDVAAICRAHAFDIGRLDASFAALKPFEEAGLVAREGTVVRLTSSYLMAIRPVAMAFDTHSSHQTLASRVA